MPTIACMYNVLLRKFFFSALVVKIFLVGNSLGFQPVYADENSYTDISSSQKLYMGQHLPESPPNALGVFEEVVISSGKPQAIKISSNSLLGSMLMAKVYQEDPHLNKLLKRQGLLEPILFLPTTAIVGIPLAQGIYLSGLAYKEPLNPNTRKGRPRLMVPGVTTTIIGGLGLTSVFGSAIWQAHYNKKIKKRQKELQLKVDSIFEKLNAGFSDDDVKLELMTLVPYDTAQEFLSLWHSVQQGLSK